MQAPVNEEFGAGKYMCSGSTPWKLSLPLPLGFYGGSIKEA